MSSSVVVDLDSELPAARPDSFSSVNFCVEGSVDSRVPELLEKNGAKQGTYLGISTTHMIAAADADDMRVDEAKEIFDVPVVVEDWAVLSLKLGQVLKVDGFERSHKKLFASVVVATSGIKGEDLKRLWGLVTYYGGQFRKHLTTSCTHLISNRCSGNMYKVAREKGIKVVCSDWVVECVRAGSLVDEGTYDPVHLVTNPPPPVQVPVAPPPPPPVPPPSQPPPVTTAAATSVPNNPLRFRGQNPPQHVLQNQMLPQQNVAPGLTPRPSVPTPPPRSPGGQQRMRFPHPPPQQQQLTNHHMGDGQVPHSPSHFHQSASGGNPMMHQMQMQIPSPQQKQQQYQQPMTPQPSMGPPQSPQMSSPSPQQQQQMLQKSTPPLMNSPQQMMPGNQQGVQVMQQQTPQKVQVQGGMHQGQIGQGGPLQGTMMQQGSPNTQQQGQQGMPGQPLQPGTPMSPQFHGQPQVAGMQGGQMMQNHPQQQQIIQSHVPQQQQHMLQSPQGQMILQQHRPQQPGMGPQQVMMNQLPPGATQHQQQQQVHHLQQIPPNQFQHMQQQYQQQQQQVQFQQVRPQQMQPPNQQQQQFNQMQSQLPMGNQHQVRYSMQSPQGQSPQTSHFQPVQTQLQNRPQGVMGQMQQQVRPQFQNMQGQNPQNVVTHQGGGQVYRQPHPQQGQMPMFHPLQQQQRLQSPPLGVQQQQQQPQAGVNIQQQQQQVGLQQQQQSQQQLPSSQSPHMIQGQMISPQQMQQQQGYSVVITHQQFQQNQGQLQQSQQQQQQQLHPPQGVPNQGMQQQQQRMAFGQRMPQNSVLPWTPQQQMEIIQQIEKDPNAREQWNRMDAAQKQLLMQKLAQRKQSQMQGMLAGQQRMVQQQQVQQGNMGNQQQQIPNQAPSPQQLAMQGQQVVVNQQQQQQMPVGQGPPHSNVVQAGVMSPTGAAPPQQLHPNMMGPGNQQPSLMHGNQVMIHQNQVLLQNHPHAQQMQSPQQKGVPVPGSPMSLNPQQQKFLAPAPVGQARPTGIIGPPQPSPGAGGVVRTQQTFTPQVAQQPQTPQQQQGVRVHHVLIQPGQPRPPVMGVGQRIPTLQQQQGQQQQQQPNQWHTASQQRPIAPGPQSPFMRVPVPPESPSGAPSPQWNVRPQIGSPQSPGAPPNVSYVQVVNSKTKTALANLLSNRLQGNAESSAGSPVSTPTTQAICPPPPQVTVTSSPPLAPTTATTTTQSNSSQVQRRTLSNITNGCKTIQVNSFGATRVATSQASSAVLANPPRPQFYGHDPQLKLPPGGFLLGCVFYSAAEFDKASQWSVLIRLHGGSLTNEYSPAVTHVLSDTSRIHECPQMLRDGKRLVTAFWLNDVVEREAMVPPFQPFHIPALYSKVSPPLKGHIVSTTNFPQKERTRLKRILQLLGAQVTPYFTKLNTMLLCNRPEGQKYQKAREWKTAVVNTQFLAEVYFGQPSALTMMHSPKYQCFSPDNPLRLDYSIIPHFLAAWKMPVRVAPEVLANWKQPCKVDLIASIEPPCKKIKLENGSHDSPEGEVPMDTEISLERPENGECESTSSSSGVIDDKSFSEADSGVGQTPTDQLSEEKDKGENSSKEPAPKKEALLENPPVPIKTEPMDTNGNSVPEDMDESSATDECKPIIENGPQQVSMPQSNSNSNDDSSNGTTGLSISQTRTFAPVVIVSGFQTEKKAEIEDRLRELGGVITSDWKQATHLVVRDNGCTTNLFMAICRLRFIVNERWVTESAKEGRFLDEMNFVPDNETFEKLFGTTLAEILDKPVRHLLFKGVTFFLTPGEWNCKKDVEKVIEAAGGVVDRNNKSLRHIRDYSSRFPKRAVIITSPEDFDIMQQHLLEAKRPHVLNVYTSDFVWYSVGTQTLRLTTSKTPAAEPGKTESAKKK